MMKVNLALIFACPLIFLLIHAALSRAWPLRSSQKTAIVSILVSTACCLAILWNYVNQDLSMALYVLTVLLSMGYIYFHIFNMGETARRIRILIELWKEGPVSESDLLQVFEREDPIQVRLDRLVSLGQLRKKDGAYYLERRLLFRAAIGVAGWRSLLGYANAPEN